MNVTEIEKKYSHFALTTSTPSAAKIKVTVTSCEMRRKAKQIKEKAQSTTKLGCENC